MIRTETSKTIPCAAAPTRKGQQLRPSSARVWQNTAFWFAIALFLAIAYFPYV